MASKRAAGIKLDSNLEELMARHRSSQNAVIAVAKRAERRAKADLAKHHRPKKGKEGDGKRARIFLERKGTNPPPPSPRATGLSDAFVGMEHPGGEKVLRAIYYGRKPKGKNKGSEGLLTLHKAFGIKWVRK